MVNESSSHPHPHDSPAIADDDYRLTRGVTEPDQVGPATYTPRVDAVKLVPPAISFGTQQRFVGSKMSYISPRHNSDLLCSASPGPKYHISATPATYARAPALSWGEKPTPDTILKKQALAAMNEGDVGPALYTPKLNYVKPSAARTSFGKADRFKSTGGVYALNNSPDTGTGDLINPQTSRVKPAAPSYSFAKGAPPAAGSEFKPKARTSFMTHSIRGGLAKPATLECNIGPGHYTPRTGEIELNRRQHYGFGTAGRFIKAGTQYISAEHARSNVGQVGPGPKYFSHTYDLSYEPKIARTSGLKWIP